MFSLGAGAGCGGDSDPTPAREDDPIPPLVVCEAFTACGGDPTGSWTIVQSCFAGPSVREGTCASVPGTGPVRLEQTGYEVEGAFAINSDGSASLTAGSRESLVYDAPRECADCQMLEDEFSNPGAGRSEASCTASETSCHCEIELEIPRSTEAGSWVATDSTLAFTSSGSALTFEFCREGDAMRLSISDREFRLERR